MLYSHCSVLSIALVPQTCTGHLIEIDSQIAIRNGTMPLQFIAQLQYSQSNYHAAYRKGASRAVRVFKGSTRAPETELSSVLFSDASRDLIRRHLTRCLH